MILDVLPQDTRLFDGEEWVGSERYVETCNRLEIEKTIEQMITQIDEEEITNIPYPKRCSVCYDDIYDVQERGAELYEIPPDWIPGELEDQEFVFPRDDYEEDDGNSLICYSCRHDGVKCIDCGLSEKLVKRFCDRNVRFKVDKSVFPNVHRCETCWERNMNAECLECGGRHEFFGYGYCPYYNEEMNEILDTENVIVYEQKKITEIKEELKSIVDIVFHVGKKIPEGAYTDLMHHIKVTHDKIG